MVTGAEERRIETVLLEGSIGTVRDREVSLCLVVQARNSADVANKVKDDLVEEEDDDDDPPDVSKVVLDVDVLQTSSWVFFTVSSPGGQNTCGFDER